MTMEAILQKHGLTQRDVASGAGVTLSSVSDIVNGKRCPRTDTVNRLLAYLRRFEPALTYEQVWGVATREVA